MGSNVRMQAAIDPSLLEPLGQVTVNFAMLSSVLKSAIGVLLFGNSAEEQRTGQIVTAELSFKGCLHMFGCLFRHRFPGQAETRLRALIKKLEDAENKRNVLTHSEWGTAGADQPGFSTRFKTTAKQKGLVFKFEKISCDDIWATAAELATAAGELQIFMLNDILHFAIEDPINPSPTAD